MEEQVVEKKPAYGYGKRPLWQWILLYVIIGVILYGLIYYFVAGRNGGNNYANNYSNNPQYQNNQQSPQYPTDQGKIANQIALPLVAENNSGESGKAVLKEENGQVTVTISLIGFTSSTPQPAHIHVGACPGVGAVKYPLTPVVNGASTTVLPVTLQELKQQEPLAINVHKSATEVSVYTSCGPLVIQ